jgi:hypothetical protein
MRAVRTRQSANRLPKGHQELRLLARSTVRCRAGTATAVNQRSTSCRYSTMSCDLTTKYEDCVPCRMDPFTPMSSGYWRGAYSGLPYRHQPSQHRDAFRDDESNYEEPHYTASQAGSSYRPTSAAHVSRSPTRVPLEREFRVTGRAPAALEPPLDTIGTKGSVSTRLRERPSRFAQWEEDPGMGRFDPATGANLERSPAAQTSADTCPSNHSGSGFAREGSTATDECSSRYQSGAGVGFAREGTADTHGTSSRFQTRVAVRAQRYPVRETPPSPSYPTQAGYGPPQTSAGPYPTHAPLTRQTREDLDPLPGYPVCSTPSAERRINAPGRRGDSDVQEGPLERAHNGIARSSGRTVPYPAEGAHFYGCETKHAASRMHERGGGRGVAGGYASAKATPNLDAAYSESQRTHQSVPLEWREPKLSSAPLQIKAVGGPNDGDTGFRFKRTLPDAHAARGADASAYPANRPGADAPAEPERNGNSSRRDNARAHPGPAPTATACPSRSASFQRSPEPSAHPTALDRGDDPGADVYTTRGGFATRDELDPPMYSAGRNLPSARSTFRNERGQSHPLPKSATSREAPPPVYPKWSSSVLAEPPPPLRSTSSREAVPPGYPTRMGSYPAEQPPPLRRTSSREEAFPTYPTRSGSFPTEQPPPPRSTSSRETVPPGYPTRSGTFPSEQPPPLRSTSSREAVPPGYPSRSGTFLSEQPPPLRNTSSPEIVPPAYPTRSGTFPAEDSSLLRSTSSREDAYPTPSASASIRGLRELPRTPPSVASSTFPKAPKSLTAREIAERFDAPAKSKAIDRSQSLASEGSFPMRQRSLLRGSQRLPSTALTPEGSMEQLPEPSNSAGFRQGFGGGGGRGRPMHRKHNEGGGGQGRGKPSHGGRGGGGRSKKHPLQVGTASHLRRFQCSEINFSHFFLSMQTQE